MRRILQIIALCLLCATLCGCNSWMDGKYTSVTPYDDDHTPLPPETVEVTNYNQLQKALLDLVESCGTESVFYTKWSHKNSGKLMDDAIRNVMTSSPIAAYAVEDIHYEAGTSGGRDAISVQIKYRYERSEILRIRQVSTVAEAQTLITAALEACDPGAVIRVANYTHTDLAQIVQDYVDAHPDTCMELPQVSSTVYPDGEGERIISVAFTYQTSRESLRKMQQTVAPIFESASLYISPEAEDLVKFQQLYAFLMQRFNYTIETSITPSYSLLHHGVGDSKAFATVYGAMCRKAGLQCQVISGTKDGSARYWDLITLGDIQYHVDLLYCRGIGAFRTYTDNQMNGYVWDYSAYQQPEQATE